MTLSCGTGTLTVKEENDGTAGIYWSDVASAWNNTENADEIDRTIPLTTIVVGGESNNYLLSVSDRRRPVAIKAIKSINGGANAIVANGTATVRFDNNDDVDYIDQYGETMSATTAKDFFDFAGTTKFGKGADKYAYGVKADFTTTNHLGASDAVLKTGSYNLTLTAGNVAAVMNDTVKFSIAQADAVGDVVADWDVAGKVLSLSVATVPVDRLSNLSIPSLSKQHVVTDLTVYANGSAAGKSATNANDALTGTLNVPTAGEVKVTGTYDGKTLDVPEPYLVRSTANFTYSGKNIATVSGGALKIKDLYDVNSAQLTRKDGALDAEITVYKSTAVKDSTTLLGTCKTKITLSDEAPKAAKVEWVYNAKAIESFTINASNTSFTFVDGTGSAASDTRVDNTNELWGGRYWVPSVVVYDQYGQIYATDSVEFTIKDYVENTGAFAHKENNSSIAANGSSSAAINGAELGDTFTVTAAIEGVSATAKVTLGSDGSANITATTNSDETFRKTYLGYDR